MTDQKIINNAPEGATHVDNDGDYWLISSQDKPQAYFYGSWSYCEPREDIRSLTDIQRIVELEKEVSSPQGLWVTSQDLQVWKLRQQAKALFDFEVDEDIGSVAYDQVTKSLTDKSHELRMQAKALKEQVKL